MSERIPEVTSGNCRRCGKPLAADAKLCTRCGTYVKSGLNAKTIARAKGAGKLGLAMIVGATAAVVGGVIWAGIAVGISMEIGYVAWGIGGLAGFAVICCTEERSARVATAAAGFAVLGIFVGKCLIVVWLAPTAEVIAPELAKNPVIMVSLVTQDLLKHGDVDPALKAHLESDDDKPPSEELKKKLDEFGKKVEGRVLGMGPAQKAKLALPLAEKIVEEQSFLDNIGYTLSPWDALWLFLAVGTAWKMGAGQEG